MGEPFDPLSFGIPSGDLPPAPARERPPRHRRGEWFVRGPLPWPWIVRAGSAPGKALLVGLAVWREAGRLNRRTVRLSLSALARQVGTHRHTALRGLQALEAAGLVQTRRRPGRALEVTLCELSASS